MSKNVFVVQGTNKKKRVYHDTKGSCQNARRSHSFEEITEQEAKDRGLRRCKHCSESVDKTACDRSYYNALIEAAND